MLLLAAWAHAARLLDDDARCLPPERSSSKLPSKRASLSLLYPARRDVLAARQPPESKEEGRRTRITLEQQEPAAIRAPVPVSGGISSSSSSSSSTSRSERSTLAPPRKIGGHLVVAPLEQGTCMLASHEHQVLQERRGGGLTEEEGEPAKKRLPSP